MNLGEAGAPRPGPPGFRAPRQQRSRHTLQQLAAATEWLLLQRGPDGVTVQDVVRRANSSVGSFYARFENRDAALRYVEDRFWTRIEDQWSRHLDPGRWRNRTALEIVVGFVRPLMRAMTADRPRFRAFVLEALLRPDPYLLQRLADLDRRIARKVVALLAQRCEKLSDHSQEEIATETVLRVLSAIRDAVLVGLPTASAERRLALSLVHMLSGFLDLEDRPRDWPALLRIAARGPAPLSESLG